MLMLTIQYGLVLLSWALRLIDRISLISNYAIQWFLSLLPGGQSPFDTILPHHNFHPGVLITGTSSGIGRDVALALAKKGYTVFAGVRRVKDGERLLQEFDQTVRRQRYERTIQGCIEPVIMDVTSTSSITTACQAVEDYLDAHHLPLVGLINNAGISGTCPMELASDEFIKNIMHVNYYGPIHLTQRTLPLLRKARGRVINVTSVTTWVVGPGYGAYCASKAAMHAASMAWRLELARFGVSLSVVEPGITKTALWGKLGEQLKYHQTRLQSLEIEHPRLRNTKRRRGFRGVENTTTTSLAADSHHTPPVSPTASVKGIISNATTASQPCATPTSSPMLPLEAPASITNENVLRTIGSPVTQQLYYPMFRRLQGRQSVNPWMAFPTVHCVEAISHALTSPFPKTTYRVGWDARIASVGYAVLGEPFIDWVYRIANVV
ncbi:hypothetical protein IWQ61_001245 [Dispira simplex]|nr:hypothetical protein IWQ61_001245 [Dispira simplex]